MTKGRTTLSVSGLTVDTQSEQNPCAILTLYYDTVVVVKRYGGTKSFSCALSDRTRENLRYCHLTLCEGPTRKSFRFSSSGSCMLCDSPRQFSFRELRCRYINWADPNYRDGKFPYLTGHCPECQAALENGEALFLVNPN